MTIGGYGQVFLAVLGFALQRFPCASIKAMDIQPSNVEMAVAGVRKGYSRDFDV